jgi:hypothetical protein
MMNYQWCVRWRGARIERPATRSSREIGASSLVSFVPGSREEEIGDVDPSNARAAGGDAVHACVSA